MGKQTIITIETDSLLLLRGRSSLRAWCPRCGAEAEMVPLTNARVVTNMEPPTLEKWLNSGDLHQIQSSDGATLTCLNSLLALVQKTST